MCLNKAMIKNLPANARDVSLIPGSGRSPGEGNVNPLQNSCVEIPMDGGTWWAIVLGVAHSWTGLELATKPPPGRLCTSWI